MLANKKDIAARNSMLAAGREPEPLLWLCLELLSGSQYRRHANRTVSR